MTTYTLHLDFPGVGPWKSYTGLTYDELVAVFTKEVRQSIINMGGVGYDPTNMLRMMGIIVYTEVSDPEGRLWQAAANAEIERLTWRFVKDNEGYLTDFGQRRRLPDNISWWVTEEKED